MVNKTYKIDPEGPVTLKEILDELPEGFGPALYTVAVRHTAIFGEPHYELEIVGPAPEPPAPRFKVGQEFLIDLRPSSRWGDKPVFPLRDGRYQVLSMTSYQVGGGEPFYTVRGQSGLIDVRVSLLDRYAKEA